MATSVTYAPLESNDFDKYVPIQIDRVTKYNKSTGALEYYLDQVKNGTLSNSQETVYGTGAGGVRLTALDKDKGVEFTCENGYMVLAAVADQYGSDITEATKENPFTDIDYLEFLSVGADNTVTLSNEPVGEVGAEVPFIYAMNKDGTAGKKFVIGATASETEFAYDPATKKITLPTTPAKEAVGTEGQPDYQPAVAAAPVFKPGDQVIVQYVGKAEMGKAVVNDATQFSGSGRFVIDYTCADICDQSIKRHGRTVIFNGKVDGNFEQAWGDDPMVHNLKITAMLDPCGGAQGNLLSKTYLL